jgi:predicted 3-demethylubiquinone-9 3-methyltransferase (glyoxalase superfamily)
VARVLTVAFRLNGQQFTGLNGGPKYKFTEAVSFVVNCETQAEVDNYWDFCHKEVGRTPWSARVPPDPLF